MCKVKNNGPMYYMVGNITVCLWMVDGVPAARGLGIGSRCDEFDPAEGRKYARDRAKEALGRKADCRAILIDAPRNNAYDWFDSSVAQDLFGNYKGYYMPKLTATEQRLLENHGSMVRPAKRIWRGTAVYTLTEGASKEAENQRYWDGFHDAMAGKPIVIQSGN
jgi:hypothetical protein